MALDFARLGGSESYPKRDFDGQEDQSYGFQPAFKLQTGNTRGTQTVGYGGAKIDGANNRIVITNPADGTSIGMGIIPGTTANEFGFFSLNEEGGLVMKIVNGTLYIYDLENDKNIMQTGKLPDGSYGSVVAKEGIEVEDVFS
jgi:hypothetical protein